MTIQTGTITPTNTKSPVEYCRPEYHEMLPYWERIRATVEGEDSVKLLGEKILPRPNPSDTTPENQQRYQGYLTRAVFYNVSGRTLDGLTGFVFQKEPTVEVPSTLKSIESNVDGSGVTLNQQAKEALRLNLSLGRAGLLVDYPKVERATSKQQLDDGKVSPAIVLYEPEDITNWRTSTIGSKVMLDLLVLRENLAKQKEGDEFALASEIQYRVLTRDDQGVKGRIFVKKGDGSYEHDPAKDYIPVDSKGKPLTIIPWTFIGAENNDAAIDEPPLLDLVNLNLAHFRNSADHEESCYMVGQPTPWLAGLTQTWVDDVLKGKVHLGARAMIPLPVGAQAGLLQAEPNSMPFEAMKHKELQMVALGAKLVEQKEVQRTATEAGMDHAGEVSTLSSCAVNVFLAYKTALGFAGEFVGAETTNIEFELGEPLNLVGIDAQKATAIMALLNGRLIDFEEARWQLKKAGWAWKDDKEVQDNTAAGEFDTIVPPVKPGAKPSPSQPPNPAQPPANPQPNPAK